MAPTNLPFPFAPVSTSHSSWCARAKAKLSFGFVALRNTIVAPNFSSEAVACAYVLKVAMSKGHQGLQVPAAAGEDLSGLRRSAKGCV